MSVDLQVCPLYQEKKAVLHICDLYRHDSLSLFLQVQVNDVQRIRCPVIPPKEPIDTLLNVKWPHLGPEDCIKEKCVRMFITSSIFILEL